MILYLLRRMLVAALLVFAVASAALVMSRLAPGDYASQALGVGARPETLAAARARYGLDRPVSTQYVDWIGRVVRLDFGRSLAYDRPVRDLISERALNTAVLALAALVLATAVGLPLGVVSGARPGGWMAAAVRGASMLLLSMPPLLTSLLLVFIAARTGWLPVGGMRSADAGGGLADLVRHMIVPVLALALPVGALLERLQSQAIADVVYQPFVLATFARGVPLRRVLWRDAFKASLKPVAAIYGVIVGTLLSGSFAVEIVTAWPGLGRLTLDALRARDVYLVAGCAAAGALFLAVGTFLSDAALAVVDPRATE